jgi:beta-lactamase regulating signal transducer with metallopeptidase domain
VRAPLGRGPQGSVIIGGDDVVLAAAGLARPTLVVSAGALARLDDAELAAAIAHERAHIRRYHRYVLLYAELCRVLGRPLPGTARAVRQLRFHIERDADRSAVRERADRLALASAICKAATGATTRAGMAALGGDGTAARVRELLQDVAVGGPRGLRPLAVAVTAVAVAAALSLPSVVSGLGDPVVLCGG